MPEKRILVVEDEATTREILTDVLRGEGYEVDSVATAGAATTCLQSINYALVLADWVLPDGDGIDVADAAAQLGSKTLVVSGERDGVGLSFFSDLLPLIEIVDRHQAAAALELQPHRIKSRVRDPVFWS